MEQSAVYDAIAQLASNHNGVDVCREYDGTVQNPWSVKIATLVCPSDPVGNTNNSLIGSSNYYANRVTCMFNSIFHQTQRKEYSRHADLLQDKVLLFLLIQTEPVILYC
jgi:hypothetical protein